MLNKTLAGFFAFFLGMFGVHYFYIGKWWKGVLQMGAFWTFIFLADVARGPGEDLFGMLIAITVLSAVITGITWWAMPEEKWRKKYDPESLAGERGFGAMGLPAPSKNTKALKAEGIRYYRSADYDLAIEAFLEAADADIADPGTHFNLACSYAQLGQYPESMRHLELSVTFGLPKPERIEKHPALAAMRKHTAFKNFRENNYRRLNLLEAGPKAVEAPTVIPKEETLEDFATPPPTVSDAPPREAFSADTPPPQPDLLEQITRLRELHDAGVLTQLEYQKQKERLLG
ncbi:NINE protein [Neolewinella agarilytica]|uniref:NINE protein n=1 Tax=Neolewinella agarilytica TaxID=478744 RepID=UPI0023542B1B|nr:NINE protein [Neolewinella agarilytica]